MTLRIYLLALALLLPSTSWAAISHISTTESTGDTVGQSSKTISTVASTGDALGVCTQSRGSTTGAAVTGIVRGAQSYTLVRTQVQNASPTYRVEQWILPNATAGTIDTVVTYANALNDHAQGVAVSRFAGVALSSPVDSSSGAGGSSTAIGSTITTVANGAMIWDCAIGQDNAGLTVGAGQTSQSNRLIGLATTAQGDGAGVSTTLKATAGQELMDWTQGAAFTLWAHSATALTPAGGTDPGTSAPTKATLTWTNGSDQGANQSGVASATVLRCTGAGCTPTANLITVPAANGSAGSHVDNSVALNTTYGYSVFNTDGVPLKSINFIPTQYITTGGTFRNVLGVRDFTQLADNTDLGADFDAGYTGYTNCGITSGTARSTVLNDTCLESYNASNPDNQWVQLALPTLSGAVSQNFGLWCRLDDAPTITGYVALAFLDIDFFDIWEVTADSYANLANSPGPTHVNGDKYRFECDGSTQKFYRIRGTAETLLVESSDATITSGKTGLSMQVATGGSLAGVQTNFFAMGEFSTTPDVEPTITGLAVDATGANVTYGAVTPSYVVVRLFNSTTSTDVRHPISDFPGGRLTQTWADGWDGVCLLPVNSLQVTNTVGSAYRCVSLAGVTTPIDTVPPVLSGCTPTTDLPEGQTTATVSCVLDKPAICNIDTTDIPVLTMQTTIAMSTAGLVCSVDLTGLSAGTITRYVGAYTAHPFDETVFYPTVTNQAITITILATPGADTTRPTDVTNLTATLSGLVATLNWSAATDAGGIAGYQVYQSNDGCVTPVLAGQPITTTTTQVNLAYNTTPCWTVRAIDTSNNLSLNHSNTFSLTTGPRPDLFPPSDMANLQADCGYTASCVLTWDNPTDEDSILITSSIEFCTVISPSTDCSNFAVFQSLLQPLTLKADLAVSTRYCFRGQHSDGTNVGGYSATVCGTTNATGIGTGRPRAPLRFGVTRPTNTEIFAPSVERPAKP